MTIVQLHVLACLPDRALTTVRTALGTRHALVAVDRWDDLAHRTSTQVYDVAVLDPAIESAASGNGNSRTIPSTGGLPHRALSLPPLPVVLYVPVTAAALRALNSIERGGEHALILAGHDDEPSRMRETIEFAARPIVTMQVLRRIEPQLRLLPAPLARGVRLMFAQPDAFKCIETLAEVAGLPRRTTDRLLAGSGLAPANRLRGVAKMCMVYRALSRSGLHGEIVAERLGYSSDRALHRHVERVTAYSPARLRRLPRMEVAVLLANRARRVSQPDDMADEESLIRDSA